MALNPESSLRAEKTTVIADTIKVLGQIRSENGQLQDEKRQLQVCYTALLPASCDYLSLKREHICLGVIGMSLPCPDLQLAILLCKMLLDLFAISAIRYLAEKISPFPSLEANDIHSTSQKRNPS